METVYMMIICALILICVWLIFKNVYLKNITKCEHKDGSILVNRDHITTNISIDDIDGIELTSASQVNKYKSEENFKFLNNQILPFHISAFGGFICMETLIIYMKTGKHYVIYFIREQDREAFMDLVGQGQ